MLLTPQNSPCIAFLANWIVSLFKDTTGEPGEADARTGRKIALASAFRSMRHMALSGTLFWRC